MYCLICTNVRCYARKLCRQCYNRTNELVNSGQTTWEARIRVGKAGPLRSQEERRKLTKCFSIKRPQGV